MAAATQENLDLLAGGVLRLRQGPGPNNALGLIKFMLPNEEHVYLHATPARRLFARSRRDYSHGCVRVEDPVALAEWVFTGSGEWSHKGIAVKLRLKPPRIGRGQRLCFTADCVGFAPLLHPTTQNTRRGDPGRGA